MFGIKYLIVVYDAYGEALKKHGLCAAGILALRLLYSATLRGVRNLRLLG